MATTHTLELRRVIPATPARVFEAWTNPEVLSRWFMPALDYTAVIHEADARVGGRYRFEMQKKEGGSSIVTGEYREVDPPTRLVFTWKWESNPQQETLVTVEFHPSGKHTEVTITHTLFTTETERDYHNEGWTGCMSCLEAAMQA